MSSDVVGLKTVAQVARNCDISDQATVDLFLKLFVLLYADDTVVFSETPDELQNSLKKIEEYCSKWKLKLNANKCKIVIFSRGKVNKYPKFVIEEKIIEVVSSFVYLGLKLNYNNRWKVAQKDLYDRASRSMFALFKKNVKQSTFHMILLLTFSTKL